MYLVSSGVIPSINDSRRLLERATALEVAAASLRAVKLGVVRLLAGSYRLGGKNVGRAIC